jgi:hypothetical protein
MSRRCRATGHNPGTCLSFLRSPASFRSPLCLADSGLRAPATAALHIHPELRKLQLGRFHDFTFLSLRVSGRTRCAYCLWNPPVLQLFRSGPHRCCGCRSALRAGYVRHSLSESGWPARFCRWNVRRKRRAGFGSGHRPSVENHHCLVSLNLGREPDALPAAWATTPKQRSAAGAGRRISTLLPLKTLPQSVRQRFALPGSAAILANAGNGDGVTGTCRTRNLTPDPA